MCPIFIIQPFTMLLGYELFFFCVLVKLLDQLCPKEKHENKSLENTLRNCNIINNLFKQEQKKSDI